MCIRDSPRADGLGTQSLYPRTQSAISGNHRDPSVTVLRHHVDDGVVARPRRLDDSHSRPTGRSAGASLDDHRDVDGTGQTRHAGGGERCHGVEETFGRCPTVPPPTVGNRTDDIGGVDDKEGK